MPHAHPSGFPSPCCDRGGQAPALRLKNAPGYRRARACPSPGLDLGKDRSSGAPDPEQVDGKKTPRVTVGRGPVPRHAAVHRTALLGP